MPAEVAFTWGGTGANVVGLQCLLAPWQAVICPDTAHIHVDECGAPERFTGAKLIDVPTPDGKLRPDQIVEQLHLLGDMHHVQPRVVAITQSTEQGSLYQPDEVAALAEIGPPPRDASCTWTVPGSPTPRPPSAATCGPSPSTPASTCSPSAAPRTAWSTARRWCSWRPSWVPDVRFVRKQAGQLPSKMRFVAAQFEALLADDLWLRNADPRQRHGPAAGRAGGGHRRA